MTQDDALKILKSGQNVFLTGEPGAGKSHTVNAYVVYLRSHGIGVAVTASTGIAATHIGGMTIHSWSGIGIAKELSRGELAEIASRDKLVRRMKETRVLIIDEISMLDGRMLSLVDRVCKAVRQSVLPFGGLQIVLVGDFFQLPPVNRDGGDVQFAFDAQAWHEARLTTCYLTEQHRQEDRAFLGILAALRGQELNEEHQELLVSRRVTTPGDMTKLYSHNADVDRMNQSELAKLPGKSQIYMMRSHGARPVVEQIKRGCLSPERLELKVGAKVMFTKNNPELGFVNGTTGTVEGTTKVSGHPLIRLRSGRTLAAEPMDWSIVADGTPLATVVQIPLRLAWAMTVHKSQGMSLDAAYVDLSGAFAYGQGYVALSRVRSLAGLHLGGLNERALQVDPRVVERDGTFRENSLLAEERLGSLKTEEVVAAHEQFIIAAGGTMETIAVDKTPKVKLKEPKENRYKQTLELIVSGKSVTEVARERSLTSGTIIEHLAKLKELNKLPAEKIRHIFSADGLTLSLIHAAMIELGFDKMKPVYERLKGKYSYETLRIANLLLVEKK